jgi:lysophospholipase
MAEVYRPFVFSPTSGRHRGTLGLRMPASFSSVPGRCLFLDLTRQTPIRFTGYPNMHEGRDRAAMDQVLFSTPGNPIPENRTEGFFETHDGLQLRYAVFRSSASVAKGTVVLLHGRNEYIEKYYETIRDLTDKGLWVATFDLRGQGNSARLLKTRHYGHVRRFVDYEHDLDTFLEKIVLPDTRLPFYILAHSTGALIALSAAPYLSSRIERMVLTAPFIGLSGQAASSGTIRRLATVACSLGLGAFPLARKLKDMPFTDNPLTSDEVRFERNQAISAAYPDLLLGLPTARWLLESFSTIDRSDCRATSVPASWCRSTAPAMKCCRSATSIAKRRLPPSMPSSPAAMRKRPRRSKVSAPERPLRAGPRLPAALARGLRRLSPAWRAVFERYAFEFLWYLM